MVSIFIAFQIVLLMTIFLHMSIGAMPRFTLLDQISIADKIFMGMPPYPSPNSEVLWGVSVYFPGIALLSVLLLNIVPSASIVIVLLCMASVVTFCFILLQKHIVYSFYKDYDTRNFWPVMIVTTLIICPSWLTYSVEFKADSLAYLIGATCVILNHKNKNNFIFALIMGIIAGSALIFKQQYVGFIAGYMTWVILTRDRKDIVFAIGMFVSSFSIAAYVFNSEDMMFWTVRVLADDGFMAIQAWLGGHSKFALVSFIALFGLFALNYTNNLNLGANQFMTIAHDAFKTPFTLIILFMFGFAFLSSWKIGGNIGNTAFGVFLFSPIFLVIFEKANRNIMVALSAVAITLHVPSIGVAQDRIEQAYIFKSQAEAVFDKNCSNLVIGSNLYYAIRDAQSGCDYQNYYTHSNKNNTNLTIGAEVRSLILDDRNNIFILENFPKIVQLVSEQDNINIVFKNSIGFIAVRK